MPDEYAYRRENCIQDRKRDRTVAARQPLHLSADDRKVCFQDGERYQTLPVRRIPPFGWHSRGHLLREILPIATYNSKAHNTTKLLGVMVHEENPVLLSQSPFVFSRAARRDRENSTCVHQHRTELTARTRLMRHSLGVTGLRSTSAIPLPFLLPPSSTVAHGSGGSRQSVAPRSATRTFRARAEFPRRLNNE